MANLSGYPATEENNDHRDERMTQQLPSCQDESADPPATLAWQQISFTVANKKLLNGVTGVLEPRRITGILGPSGSAKTTLLNVLSGRQKTSGRRLQGHLKIEGRVFFAGMEMQPADFRKQVAYVFQDSALPPTETPRECLEFSAFLRLPTSVSDKERTLFVDQMLDNLNLVDCADNTVGSALFKGISGGEQKRTAVGVELISHPKQIFLDEPLSGLDSFNAVEVIHMLKKLSHSGVPVLMTLHQPGSEVFSLLDDLIVLHQGTVCFQGPAKQLANHFRGLGFTVPPSHNPTDVVMFLIQTSKEEVVRSIMDKWHDSALCNSLLSKVRRSSVSSSHSKAATNDGKRLVSALPPKEQGGRCCSSMLKALVARELRAAKRSWTFIFSQVVVFKLITNVVWGFLFFRMGAWEDSTHYAPNCLPASYDQQSCIEKFNAHFAALSCHCMTQVFDAMTMSVNLLHVDRAMFLRESAGGYYHVAPFVMARMMNEASVVIIGCVTASLASYWMIGYQMSFMEMLFGTVVLTLSVLSLMWCTSALAKSREQAMAMSTLPWILQFAFSGVLLMTKNIPVWIRWVRWFCPLYYGLGFLTVTEFRYVFLAAKQCQVDDHPGCQGVTVRESILDLMGYDMDWIWWPNLTMCLVLFVAYRALAAFILWRNSKFAL